MHTMLLRCAFTPCTGRTSKLCPRMPATLWRACSSESMRSTQQLHLRNRARARAPALDECLGRPWHAHQMRTGAVHLKCSQQRSVQVVRQTQAIAGAVCRKQASCAHDSIPGDDLGPAQACTGRLLVAECAQQHREQTCVVAQHCASPWSSKKATVWSQRTEAS